MALKNSTILEHAVINGSNDFAQRVPNPTISGYQATIDSLFDHMNGQLINEFANMLVGMIGTYVESKRFENPLRELKKPASAYGNTERHVAVKYLKAHAPKVDDETLLKLEKPEFVEWFYSVNQHRRYEFSWSRFELQRVFSNADAYGLDDLLASTLDQQMSSDSYDEMTSMIEAFSIADNNEKFNLYRSHISSAPTDKATGQELLVKIRTDAGQMQFPSIKYNQLDIPVFESPKTLILWVTPEVDAQLDVYALADLFHLERAEVNFRKIVIPEFPIANVYAALTSEDFIYCRDVYFGIEPPFYNPAQRTYKYYLYHDQMIGVNPVANCVLYTTDEATTTNTITVSVTGMNFTTTTGNVEIGGSLDIGKYLKLDGSVTPANTSIKVEPQSATYDVAGERAGAPLELNSRTYVDNAGILHVQSSGLKIDDTITVTATSTYNNPSGETEKYNATFVATVVDSEKVGAKESFVSDNSNLVYTNEGNEVSYNK